MSDDLWSLLATHLVSEGWGNTAVRHNGVQAASTSAHGVMVQLELSHAGTPSAEASHLLSLSLTHPEQSGCVSVHVEADSRAQLLEVLAVVIAIADELSPHNYDTCIRLLLNAFDCAYHDGWAKPQVLKPQATPEQLTLRAAFLEAVATSALHENTAVSELFDAEMGVSPQALAHATVDETEVQFGLHLGTAMLEIEATHAAVVTRLRAYDIVDMDGLLAAALSACSSQPEGLALDVAQLPALLQFAECVGVESSDGWMHYSA